MACAGIVMIVATAVQQARRPEPVTAAVANTAKTNMATATTAAAPARPTGTDLTPPATLPGLQAKSGSAWSAASAQLMTLAHLPEPDDAEVMALRAELAGHPDAANEVARVIGFQTFQSAYARWREAASSEPASAAEVVEQRALADALLAELDGHLARRELTAAEAAAARRTLSWGR